MARGCTRIGYVTDTDFKDLRRKAVRLGGDTVVLSFRSDDLDGDPGGGVPLPTCAGAAAARHPPHPRPRR